MYKGINNDVHPRYNKEGYNFALNANIESGALPLISTDFSNELCIDLKASIIGHCIDKNQDYILFLSDNSIVRFFPKTCSTSLIYKSSGLDFGNWIECVYTQLRGCEELVYFTDGKNKYRVINLTRVKANTPVEDFNFNIKLLPLDITTSIIEGGSLNAGAYWYTMRLIDDSGTPSNWSHFYEPFYVYSKTAKYNTSIEVDKVKTTLAANFEIDASLIPSGYSFQIGIVEYSNLNRAVSNVYILNENTTFFTGTNYSRVTSLQDLIVDNLIVETIQSHTKHLNRLFIGNIAGKEYNWDKIQRAVYKTKVYYATEKTSLNLYETKRTFRHNDVYDLGIVGVFNNGSNTPVFHIPGREVFSGNPFQLGFNNKNHYTTNIKANNGSIDTVLINNLLNNGKTRLREVCTDCNTITLDYKVTTSISSGNIEFNIKSNIYGTVNPKLTVTAKYQDKTTVQTVTNTLDNKFIFIYKGSDIINLEFSVVTQNGKFCSYNGNNGGLNKFGSLSLKPVYNPNEVPAWTVYNTALKHITPIGNYNSSGLMAYYESCESYPDDVDCNGIPIYPYNETVVNGVKVYTMKKIRYHRFPDQLLEPISDKDFIYNIKPVIDINEFILELENNYPDLLLDIKEWKFVYGERNNPIVKDSGLIFNTFDGVDKSNGALAKTGVPEDSILATLPILNETVRTRGKEFLHGERLTPTFLYKQFYSPKSVTSDVLETGIIYINANYSNSFNVYSTIELGKTKATNTNFAAMLSQIKYDSSWLLDITKLSNLFTASSPIYYKIKDKVLISPVKHTQEGDGGEYLGVEANLSGANLRNMSYSNNAGIYLLDTIDNLHLPNNFNYYVDIINYTEPYTFNNTLYHELNEGDAWISPFYFSIKIPTFLFDQSALGKITSGGLGVISQWIADGAGQNIEREIYTKLLIKAYVESEIASDYRFNGTASWEPAPTTYNASYPKKFLNADKEKIGGDTEEDAIWDYKREFQKYSKDYSALISPRVFSKLPINYNYCSNCNNEYPNRIYYSDASNIENAINNLRSIKVNNYVDLDTPINTLFKSRDELFARTNKYIYSIPTRPVEIKTDNTNVYIGTASLLSIPPSRISSVDYIYGGSEQKLDIIHTEFSSYMIGNHIMEIGENFGIIENGMRNYLRNNLLPFDVVNQNINYRDYISYFNPNRLYNLVYDYIHNRVFISKKEYIARKEYKGMIELSASNTPLLVINGTKEPIDFTDTKYFIDSSFNASYNLSTKTFISFHSWIPDYTMFDSRAYYSQLGNVLYKHLDSNTNKSRLNYYDKVYDFEIEIPTFADTNQVSTFDNVVYRQDMSNTEYLPYNTLLDKTNTRINTFTHYIAYNDIQSTGLVTLSPKISLFDNSNLTFYENRFNFFIGRENNVTKKYLDWNYIEDRLLININNRSYIDKYFDSNFISVSNFMERGRLRDDYMNLRLIYKPEFVSRINTVDVNNIKHKISLDLLDVKTSNTY